MPQFSVLRGAKITIKLATINSINGIIKTIL